MGATGMLLNAATDGPGNGGGMVDKSRERAKAIILELVRQAGGRLDGMTRLYKAFYFAHRYYYEKNAKLLSGWPIVHMPRGPGIDEGEDLIVELAEDGLLETERVDGGGYPETRCILLLSAPPENFDKEERAAIAKACKYVQGKTATQLSDITHDESHAWNEASSGDELNVYLDGLSQERIRHEQRAAKRVDEALQRALQI